MTQTVILTQPVRVAGSVLAAGTTQTLALDIAADLIARGFASPVWQFPNVVNVTAQNDPATGVNKLAVPVDTKTEPGSRFVLLGDSILAAENSTRSISAMARSGGVVTCTATSHALISTQGIKVSNAMPDSFNGIYQITRIDANSFSYVSDGPDEAATLSGHPSGGLFEARTTSWTAPYGWFNWTNQLYFNAGLEVAKNLSNGGWKCTYAASDAGLDFIESQLGSTKFSDLIVAFGVNDLIGGKTPTEITDAIKVLVLWGLSKNVRVWIDAIKPVGSSHASAAAINKKAPVVNRILADYAKTINNVCFVDTYSAMVDPTTGAAIANTVQSDHIHPSAFGARVKCAPVWYAAMNGVVTAKNLLVKSIFDNYGSDAESPILFDDAPWANTAGGSVNGTVTGDVAVNLTVTEAGSASIAGTIVARSDGFGYDQVCAITATANNDAVTVQLKNTVLARFQGKKIRLLAAFELTGNTAGNVKTIYNYVTQVVGGLTGYYYGGGVTVSAAQWGTTDDTISGVLMSPDVDVDAAASAVMLAVGVVSLAGAGSPTLKLGRITVIEVDA